MARAVGWLNEGATDIVRADDAEFEGQSRLHRIADRSRHPAIGHRHDQISLARGFDGELHADSLACLIDRASSKDAIGAAEIDVFKNAGARCGAAEGAHRADLAREIDQHQLARLDFADNFGADHIEGDGFGGEQDRFAHPAHHQRTDAQRIAAGDHALRRHYDKGIGAFDQTQRIHQPIGDGGITTGGDKVDDDFSVGRRLED